MIDFDFESALRVFGGIAESLDAAGVDSCVPLQDDCARSGNVDSSENGRGW